MVITPAVCFAVSLVQSIPQFKSLHLHLKEKKLLSRDSWGVPTTVTVLLAHRNPQTLPLKTSLNFPRQSSSSTHLYLAVCGCMIESTCESACSFSAAWHLSLCGSYIPEGSTPTKQVMGLSMQIGNWFRIRDVSNLLRCHSYVMD